jgi:hypothetical protein
MGGEEVPALFQGPYGEFSRDRRKVVEKRIQRVAALEVVDEGLEGYPRSNEDRLLA